MRITTRTRDALRLMVDLARQNDLHQPVQLVQAANRTGISKRYLEQLVIALKNHGLLLGVCGRKGGYKLARSPEEIKLVHIFQATAGPLKLSPCVYDPDSCIRSEFCECRMIWLLLDQRINAVLNEFSLADLADREILSSLLQTSFAQNSKDALVDQQGTLSLKKGKAPPAACAS